MKKLIFTFIILLSITAATIVYADTYSDIVYTAYGDSITDIYQDQSITKYSQLLNLKFKLKKVNNYGISSSCLADDSGSSAVSGIRNIINHSDDNKNSDVITLCFGTNDWYYGVELGTITDTNTDTYWGAFNTAISQIRNDNPYAEIIVLSPIWRTDVYNNGGSGTAPYYKNKSGVTLAQYVEEIEKMCSANSVRFVDLYSNSGIRPQTVSLYTSDGLHPNQQGHIRIANLLSGVFEETLTINRFADFIYDDGFDENDTVIPDPAVITGSISDFVNTETGATTGLDITNNRPQKNEATGNIVSKSGVYNFYIQTTGESANMFGLFSDGTYSYGVLLSNSINYGKLLYRTNLLTGETENSTSFLQYSEHYTLPSPGKNLWHFSYSEQNDAWYIYTVDADGAETFAAKITRENLQCSLWNDLGDTKPLFVYTGWGTYCFTLINDATPSAKFSLENDTLTAELYNIDEKTALIFGTYSDNDILLDVAVPEIKDKKATAKLNLDKADNIRIYFWTALEKLNPIIKSEKIELEQ